MQRVGGGERCGAACQVTEVGLGVQQQVRRGEGGRRGVIEVGIVLMTDNCVNVAAKR